MRNWRNLWGSPSVVRFRSDDVSGGPRRYIDVLVTDLTLRRSLGIECKYQKVGGTAEEKIPATIQDISAWPIAGIVCFDGPGFSEHLKSFMLSTGKAVEFAHLEEWLRLHFVLPAHSA